MVPNARQNVAEISLAEFVFVPSRSPTTDDHLRRHFSQIAIVVASRRWPATLPLLLLLRADALVEQDALVEEAAVAAVRLWSASAECPVEDDAAVAVGAGRTILAFAIRGLSPS